MLELLSQGAPAKPRVRRAAKPAGTAKAAKKSQAPGPASDRHERVAVAAYYLAERRGFEPGRELDDWFMAENMLDAGSER